MNLSKRDDIPHCESDGLNVASPMVFSCGVTKTGSAQSEPCAFSSGYHLLLLFIFVVVAYIYCRESGASQCGTFRS